MIRRVVQQLLMLLITLLVASFLIFAALYIAPGDPAVILAGPQATPEVLEQIREQNHLNDSMLVRYWDWLSGFVQGDLGESFVYQQSVSSLLAPRVSVTLALAAFGALLIGLVGIVLGVVAALFRRMSVGVAIACSLMMAVPAFVAAMILITVFAVSLEWFPVFGTGTGFTDVLYHLTLPALALGLGGTAAVTLLTRASISDELQRDHVETARSRGIPEPLVIRRHVLRNAMSGITTVGGNAIAGLVPLIVVVETAFALDGVGAFLAQSVAQKDFAVVQAICLMFVALYVVMNSLVDFINGLLDPRVNLAVVT